MATALGFPEIHQALAFLISWLALEKAAQLVLRRAKELNGNHYEVLSPAADALAGKHPLAATLLLRSMIDFTLVGGGDGVARIRGPRRHCSGRRAGTTAPRTVPSQARKSTTVAANSSF